MFRLTRKLVKAPFALATLAVIAFIAFGVWYWHFRKHVTTITATTPTAPAQSVINKGTPQSAAPSTGGEKSSTSSPSSSSPSTSSNLSLIAPWGTFVSNHSPGANGSSTEESSACNTTPGAQCYIKFTSGANVAVLPTKTANADGSVLWSWDVKNTSLTTGSWQVTAVATLNGQTKTTADPLELKVQ